MIAIDDLGRVSSNTNNKSSVIAFAPSDEQWPPFTAIHLRTFLLDAESRKKAMLFDGDETMAQDIGSRLLPQRRLGQSNQNFIRIPVPTLLPDDTLVIVSYRQAA